MKLAKKLTKTLMGCPLLLLALLSSGCQKGTSLEQFSASIKGAKYIRASLTTEVKGKPVSIEIKRATPNRLAITAGQYQTAVNEVDGIIDLDSDKKLYMAYNWTGKFAPSTGVVHPPFVSACWPALGRSPFDIASAKKWKKISTQGNDVWQLKVEAPGGEQVFEVELDSDAKLVRYLGLGTQFKVAKFEIGTEIPESDFKLTIPDGAVNARFPIEDMGIYVGQKLDLSPFKLSKPSGAVLVAFVDSKDGISSKMEGWMSKVGAGYSKLKVEHSEANNVAFWGLVSATPTLILTDNAGIVKGMWQGFDSEATPKLDQQIEAALKN